MNEPRRVATFQMAVKNLRERHGIELTPDQFKTNAEQAVLTFRAMLVMSGTSLPSSNSDLCAVIRKLRISGDMPVGIFRADGTLRNMSEDDILAWKAAITAVVVGRLDFGD